MVEYGVRVPAEREQSIFVTGVLPSREQLFSVTGVLPALKEFIILAAVLTGYGPYFYGSTERQKRLYTKPGTLLEICYFR